MYFLTLDDLWAMSVNVTGIPRPPSAGPALAPPLDPDPLYVARVVQNINLNDGSTIPYGSLVVIWDQCSHPEAWVPKCFVSYAAGEVTKTAVVFFNYLRVIKQGW